MNRARICAIAVIFILTTMLLTACTGSNPMHDHQELEDNTPYGDVNLNEQPYEIADAVLFMNYLVRGPVVFDKDSVLQVAATDCNRNGKVLEVSDLVYLIRVVSGDALPYDKLHPVGASYIADNGFVSVDQAMGAAYVVVAGDIAPDLLADNMDMQYRFDGTNTRILVSYLGVNQTFQGRFISINGPVVSVELATYEGAPVYLK
jgi:hypothetical protein